MVGQDYYTYSGEEPIIVAYPDKAITQGITTCTGLGILNHRLKKGYLGHYLTQDPSLPLLLDKAIEETQHLGDLEVAVVGNIPLSKEDVTEKLEETEEYFQKNLEEDRKYGKEVLQMIKSKGIERIQNHLEENPESYDYKIVVDTEKGKIIVEKEFGFS